MRRGKLNDECTQGTTTDMESSHIIERASYYITMWAATRVCSLQCMRHTNEEDDQIIIIVVDYDDDVPQLTI